MERGRSLRLVVASWALLVHIVPAVAQPAAGAGVAPLPPRLSDTGLYAPGSVTEIAPGRLEFAPQYPLWSDGAAKRRWIALPAGTLIDASDPDAWDFPAGTRFWKEFALGRRIETRYLERLPDGSWRFAVYVWNAEDTEATLAPVDGIAALPLQGASRTGTYAIPSETDCRACHEGAPVPVLGFGALQLSPDRDPLAPHASPRPAVDLRTLVADGIVRNLPPALLDQPPRIAARSRIERAALGYLHGNCGHCHSAPDSSGAAVPVDVVLAQSTKRASASADAVRASLVAVASRFRPHGVQGPTQVVEPGHSATSVLTLRMRSRDPRVQMPPLGTAIPDNEALALVERWIDEDLARPRTARQDSQQEQPTWTSSSTRAAPAVVAASTKSRSH